MANEGMSIAVTGIIVPRGERVLCDDGGTPQTESTLSRNGPIWMSHTQKKVPKNLPYSEGLLWFEMTILQSVKNTFVVGFDELLCSV